MIDLPCLPCLVYHRDVSATWLARKEHTTQPMCGACVFSRTEPVASEPLTQLLARDWVETAELTRWYLELEAKRVMEC